MCPAKVFKRFSKTNYVRRLSASSCPSVVCKIGTRGGKRRGSWSFTFWNFSKIGRQGPILLNQDKNKAHEDLQTVIISRPVLYRGSYHTTQRDVPVYKMFGLWVCHNLEPTDRRFGRPAREQIITSSVMCWACWVFFLIFRWVDPVVYLQER
jgi:hypothetical protein